MHLNSMMQGHMWILRRVESDSERKVEVNEVTGSLYQNEKPVWYWVGGLLLLNGCSYRYKC